MRANQARVLITGASGGIGRACVHALAAAGAAVLLSGRSEDALEAVVADVRRERPDAELRWHCADLTLAGDIGSLSEAARDWNANVLVNGAGEPSFGRFVELDAAHADVVLRTNLLAPILLTHALLPSLASRAPAQVIQMGSVLGRLALPGYSLYSASKFGLRGFTEALRRELKGSGVKVQYLGPRSTRTRFNDSAVLAYNDETRAAMDEPHRVGVALVELLESEAPERFLGFPESLAVRINGLAPSLVDAGMRAHRRALENGTSLRPPMTSTRAAAPTKTREQTR